MTGNVLFKKKSSKNVLISSDDSDSSTPVIRKKSIRNKTQKKKLDELFSSDSEDEKIIFKPVKAKKAKPVNEIMLGEISLLTSDEEDSMDNRHPKKAKRGEIGQQENNISVDLLTSDEEYQPDTTKTKTKAPAKKRKLTGTDKGPDESVSPPKRKKASASQTKSTVSKKTEGRKNAISATASTAKRKTTGIKRSKSRTSLDTDLDISIDEISPAWKDSELLAERTQIDHEIALNLIKLWEEGNTIPFIARYRKNVIGNMTPEELRETKEDYDEICNLKKKMCTVVKTVSQMGKLDNKLQGNICSARTIEELEHIVSMTMGISQKLQFT